MQSIPINTYDSPTAVLELIYRLKVKDVMTADIHTTLRTATMRHVRNTLKDHSITGMPVVEKKRILGIVSMEDVLQALDSGSIDEAVEQHMSKKLIVLEEDMPVFFAISYFGRYSYRRFPVINKHNELVGIVTSRDITTKLLIEANHEIERLERETETPSETYTGQVERWFKVYRYDFENAGYASTEIKKILKTRSIDSKTARRIAISAYELEMNLVVHSNGGSIHFLMDDNRVLVQADDTGPGIENVDLALTEGFTTATEWIRSLGFGAGMGLPNVQRVSDEFSITSEPDRGTHAKSIILLPNAATKTQGVNDESS
ncbi:MAG: CBS domain-containing protein [Spirochaetota bacterium]